MEHSHDHSHNMALTHVNRAFVIGIVLNTLFVIIEFSFGFYTNSLALIADAGHNLSDVASLILALLAFKLARISSNTKFTYGYRKTTILVSLLNACILLIAVGSIIWESIERINTPQVTQGNYIAIVAFIGIFINAITAFMFFKDKDKDLNIKGAYLHLAADALVSLGVVIAGIVIIYTNWFWLDALISLLVALIILWATWGLLRDSTILSIDGVPSNIDITAIKTTLLQTGVVIDVHHLHIWAISTTENALTCHLVVDKNFNLEVFASLKVTLKHKLEHLNIQHTTFELEISSEKCNEIIC